MDHEKEAKVWKNVALAIARSLRMPQYCLDLYERDARRAVYPDRIHPDTDAIRRARGTNLPYISTGQ